MPMESGKKLNDAADALEKMLTKHGWGVRRGWGEKPPTPNTITVIIGFKPLPYFKPQVIKDRKAEEPKSHEEGKEKTSEP